MRIGSFEFSPRETAGSMGDSGTLPAHAIVRAMMLLVGIELFRFAGDLRLNRDPVPVAITPVVSVAVNMAVGFVAALLFHYPFLRRPGSATDGER